MRTLALALLLVLVAGCATQGIVEGKAYRCYGLFNQADHNPRLRYAPSLWNIFLGVIFSELIVPPLFIFGWHTVCPVGLAVGEPGLITP